MNGGLLAGRDDFRFFRARKKRQTMFGDRQKATQEQNLFLLRVSVLVILALAAFGFLGVRIAFLTLARGQELYKLSEENIVSREKVPAPRGPILDRFGRVLATSEARFNLSVSPFHIEDAGQMEATLEAVRRLCPRASVPPVDTVMRLRPRWKRHFLASYLTMEEALPMMERQALLPGLQIEQTFLRAYPHGRDACFLTGYVGRITNAQMDTYLEQGYDRDDIVGMAELERKYEYRLRGEKGMQIVHRDARGMVLPSRIEPEPARGGAPLTLTIDLDLQTTATHLLKDRSGVLVAMDPRNGQILALASSPNFDSNHPESAGLPGNSEYDKVIRSALNPGSTFKLVTATCWLLNGGSPDYQVFCGGHITVGKRLMHCDYRYGHGWLNLQQAIERSCNLYFYDLARKMGVQRMTETAYLFGFGRPSRIGLRAQGENVGRIGGAGAEHYGNLLMMGIGQGRLVSVTPLQIVNAYAALANGGTLYSPTVVKSVGTPDGQEEMSAFVLDTIPWTDAQRQILLKGFQDVIQTRWGTGRRAKFPKEWKVAGKTSSAERVTAAGAVTDAGFVCFAPSDKPEICVYILLEGAGHGGEFAAPLAKGFLAEYFKLKEERAIPEPDLDPAYPLLDLPRDLALFALKRPTLATP
ncbi:hypothetical protein HQ520_17175 [bacterium]|nr:hypothetical protein [bacterium]